MKNSLKIILIIFLFFLFIILTSFSYAKSVFYDLSSNIFRLHIVANSDSNEDQELKLKVRDNILEYIREKSENFENKEKVIKFTSENLEELQKIAISTINENGYDYNVTLEIGNFYFPTKYYGNVSMPSRKL